MDKSASYRIVRETFENSFDKERFVYFVKNLLNLRNDQLENKHPYSEKYIPDAYKNHFSTLKRIAEYSDGESKIDILIVHLKKETSIERARSMQRNFIAWYLNGSRGSELKDAALVAFVSPDNNDWRFSLVKIDYKFEEGKNGKMKVKEEFTPARRWSFLVGINESSHTAQRQFLPILENDEDNPTLRQLEEAFSVEKVTKEFFGEYKKLFEELVKELGNNHTFKNEAVKYNINTENFAKKLLGQIVFLYFLQKKRWLGAAKDKALKQGDENFLRNLFEKKYIKYSNFFNDILEHLFYDALNKKSEKAGTFYRDYFKCQIPFLNGGLFDPEYEWDKSKIYLDDKIFARILEIFDRYNFTVDESSPIDQEVAIDPEMLGKVFENLLSENLRKGRGTYYTPREIVHYMCQESLINYLVTESKIKEEIIRKLITQQDIVSDEELSNLSSEDELEQAADKNIFLDKTQAKKLNWLLRTIKVVDPACGSGAFLVGMLQEITRACLFLDKWYLKGNKNEYQLKKETIQNSIYGVDIDPGAVEIAKLRLWLSLVVDYELEEIEPLPNLDYKIMQGNSLLEELVLGDTSIKLFNPKISKNKKMKNLLEEDKQADLFGESDRQKAIVEKLSKLHKEYFGINELEEKIKKKAEIDKIEQDLIEDSVKREVERLEKENKNIGNYLSPGVGMTEKDTIKFQKNLSKQGQIMNVLNEFKKTGVKPFFLWRLYFGDVFEEKGGFDVVIANPPYGETIKKYKNYFKEKFICSEGKYEIYKYFIEKGLSLTKKGGLLVYITPDTWLSLGYFKKLRKLIFEKYNLLKLSETLYNVFDAATVDTMLSFIKNENGRERSLNIVCGKLKNSREINISVNQKDFAINLNEKPQLIKKIERNKNVGYFCEVWQGLIAYHSKQQKRIYSSTDKKTKYHRKLLYGSSIGKYFIKWKGEYLKYGKWLHRPRPSYIFDKPKLLVQRIRNPKLKERVIATYDNKKFIDGTGLSNILVLPEFKKSIDIKYILSIINSKLINYWFSYYFSDVNIKPEQLRKIPIPKITPEQQKPFIKLVDQILEKKKDNPEADTGDLEREIDEMVYELYNLSEEEIKIIENN